MHQIQCSCTVCWRHPRSHQKRSGPLHLWTLFADLCACIQKACPTGHELDSCFGNCLCNWFLWLGSLGSSGISFWRSCQAWTGTVIDHAGFSHALDPCPLLGTCAPMICLDRIVWCVTWIYFVDLCCSLLIVAPNLFKLSNAVVARLANLWDRALL